MTDKASVINFYTESSSYRIINKNLLRRWVLKCLQKESKSLNYLSVIVCDDDYLLKVNQEYLNHDYLTDIISFQYSVEPIEGELYISIDRIRDNAKKFQCTIPNELHRVIIHGVLHLCGYQDQSPQDKDIMTVKENTYLAQREF